MDVVSEDGSTPLVWAVAAQQSEMAEVLIRKGAKVDLNLSPSSKDSPSFCLNDKGLVPLQPLHVAARAGDPDLVKLILREGAQVGGRTDRQMELFSCTGSTHTHMHGISCNTYILYIVRHVCAISKPAGYCVHTWNARGNTTLY